MYIIYYKYALDGYERICHGLKKRKQLLGFGSTKFGF